MPKLPSFAPRQEIAFVDKTGRIVAAPAFIRWLDLNLRPSVDGVVGLSDEQQTQIDQNKVDIASSATQIATNTSNISGNAAQIAVNTAAISTNASNIATNAADIASNTSLISSNAVAISANTAAIADNTSDIATNAAAISALEARIEALEFNAESLYVGQPTATAAAIYTSTGVTTTLSAATAFNGSGGPETLDVWLVPSGDSETDANKLYEGLSVADGATVDLAALVGHALNPGDAVYAMASTAATISMRLTGATRA